MVLVRAGAKPLNVARITRETLAEFGGNAIDGLPEENFVQDPPLKTPKLIEGNPLRLMRHCDPNSTDYRMAAFPILLIAKFEPFDKFAFPRHARMGNHKPKMRSSPGVSLRALDSRSSRPTCRS